MITDLILLLDNPADADAFDGAFGELEPLDIDDDLLPPESARFFMTKELACDALANLGPDAIEAVPALLRCADDLTDIIESRSMRLAAARAVWRITGDPALYIPIFERLLADTECWFRRHVVELLDEIGHPAALSALRERLADVRTEVREAARRAMAKIGRGQ
jgi:HEAT repeat protein